MQPTLVDVLIFAFSGFTFGFIIGGWDIRRRYPEFFKSTKTIKSDSDSAGEK